MKRTILCAVLLASTSAFAQQTEALLLNSSENATDTRSAISDLPVLLDEDYEVDALELVSFQADPVENEGVVVKWATISERHGEQFIVERSSDRLIWELAAEVSGTGSPEVYTPYEVLDTRPHSGISYYRLVRLEDGEALELSDLYSVRYDVSQSLMIHADHKPGHFVVSANGDITQVLLMNNRGEFVSMPLEMHGDRVQVNAENLVSGTYYVQAIVNGNAMMRPVIISGGSIMGG